MRDRKVTLKEISDRCGLSLSTVSAALNDSDGRYNADTVQYVREIAAKLGYRANQQAKILRGAQSGLIGIIKNVSLHQLTAEFTVHAGDAIHAAGYRFFSSDVYSGLLTGNGGLGRSLEIMLDMRVEGILIENQSFSEEKAESLARVIRGKTPVVLMDGYPFEGVPYVGTDFYGGFSHLGEHFLDQGFRKIILALSMEDSGSLNHEFTTKGAANWRINEAVRALTDVTSSRRAKLDILTMPNSCESGRSLADIYFAPGQEFIRQLRLIKGEPCAIIFTNDLFAVAAVRACMDAGINVPRDLALAGFDGSDATRYTVPRITSVEIPVDSIARKAVDALIKLIQKKTRLSTSEKILFPAKLAVQESSSVSSKRKSLGQRYSLT